MSGQRGSTAVVMVGVIGVAVVVALGAARAGTAAIASARADAAADAAALAAADMVALGRGPSAAVRAARETARDNGARLVRCVCRGAKVTVHVRVTLAGLADAASTARAEIRASPRAERADAD